MPDVEDIDSLDRRADEAKKQLEELIGVVEHLADRTDDLLEQITQSNLRFEMLLRMTKDVLDEHFADEANAGETPKNYLKRFQYRFVKLVRSVSRRRAVRHSASKTLTRGRR